MIVLRNRFLALLYRILALGAFLTSLVFFWREFYEYTYAPICYFEVEAGIFYLFILFLAIILNIIDLRRGISGLASSVYMPVSLAATAYCFIGGNEVASLHSLLRCSHFDSSPRMDFIRRKRRGCFLHRIELDDLSRSLYGVLAFPCGYFPR